jgi:ABC-2 type transport system permease protein
MGALTLRLDYLWAGLAIVRRDWTLFKSYRLRVPMTLLAILFSLSLFYFISRLVSVETFRTPDDYYAFVVVGLVILAVLTSTLTQPPAVIRQELVAGTFERLLITPLGAVLGVVSMLIFPLFFAIAQGIVTLAIAALVFDLSLEWSTAALALPVALLGAMAFMPFGVLMAAATVSFKQAVAGTGFVLGGISIVAGLYFPVALLPDWIQWTSEIQPFTPSVDLLRNLLVGTPLQDPAWVGLLKLAGFSAVLLPISIWVLSRAVRAGQRRGTILEF